MKIDEVTRLRAMYLTVTHGMTQDDVAALLSVSQTSVNRCYQEGLKSRRIRQQTRMIFDCSGLAADLVEQVRQVDSWNQWRARLQDVSAPNGVKVRAVRVFRSAESGKGGRSVGSRLTRFSKQAASVLYGTIRRAEICAVASGFTLFNAVDAIAGAYGGAIPDGNAEPPAKPVRFVPVWPEDVNDPRPGISSTALAERLDDIFNLRSSAGRDDAGPPRPPSLNGVPPFRPHYFKASRFRQYLEEDFPVYQKLFGSQSDPPDAKPLIARVDTLLTSIGARGKAFGRFNDLLVKHAGVSGDKLATLVAGDVGGVLVPLPGCTKTQLKRIRHINSIWNGLQPEHLEQIARRSHARGTPGVVVVSIESSEGGRAAALAAAIRAGLVNELIIDQDLADGLDGELSARGH